MRLAFLAVVAVAASFSLTGCWQLVLHEFDGDPYDPPPHDIGADPGSAGAAAGRPVRGRAEGQLASRMTIRDGFVKTKTSWARFIGTYKSNLTGSPLASAQWHGRFRSVRNRKTGRYTIKGLVLATFDDPEAGRACLKLSDKGRRAQNRRPRKPSLATVTALGGENGAETLYGVATARVRLK